MSSNMIRNSANSRPVTDPSVPPADGACHLMHLPPELRLIIYKEALATITLPVDAATPPVLQVSKLIRQEAIPVYRTALPQTFDGYLLQLQTKRNEVAEARGDVESRYLTDGLSTMEFIEEALAITKEVDHVEKEFYAVRKWVGGEVARFVEKEEVVDEEGYEADDEREDNGEEE